MKGRFIVLEGIDGCGKSTQIKHLSEWLPKSGLMPKESKIYISKEPGGTALGGSLRELLLNPPRGINPDPIAELLLYSADRAQHISQIIVPILEKGDWVISDRFSGSTFAYQGYGRELNLETIRSLEKISTQNVKADLTIWLDIPVCESLRRRSTIANDRMESEGKDFLSRVSAGFFELSKQNNWVRIKADFNEIIVKKKIEESLMKYFL